MRSPPRAPRRLRRIIRLPDPGGVTPAPTASAHAQRFVGAFALVILVGAVLLLLPVSTAPGAVTHPIDALFTAVSATAVTGLVVVDTADHWSFWGELVILLLIQIGGLGFAVGASLLLQALRRGAEGYSLRETLLMRDGAPALSLREVADLARRIVRFTLVAEAIGAALLTLGFSREMPLPRAVWFGVFHAVAAFGNAGFDLQGGFVSMIPYQTSVWVNVVLALLIQAGALGYVPLADAVRCRRWGPLPLDTKLVLLTNGVLLVAGAAAFLVFEWRGTLAEVPLWARPLAALFQSVAARTAGFATVNFGAAQAVTLFAWVGLMMVGGASGSTAGGVKLATVGVIAAAVAATLRGRAEPQVFGRRIATAVVFRAMAVVVLFVLLHFGFTAALAVSEDLLAAKELDFIQLLFETMSALATVGLSTGITPALTPAGKLILCLAMFVGRIGPLTAAYALQQRQERVLYRFPDEAVRIG